MPADLDTMQRHMMEMQSQLAFQEDAISSLDQALAQQQQQLLELRRQVELLNECQLALHNDAGPATNPTAEKPPHY